MAYKVRLISCQKFAHRIEDYIKTRSVEESWLDYDDIAVFEDGTKVNTGLKCENHKQPRSGKTRGH